MEIRSFQSFKIAKIHRELIKKSTINDFLWRSNEYCMRNPKKPTRFRSIFGKMNAKFCFAKIVLPFHWAATVIGWLVSKSFECLEISNQPFSILRNFMSDISFCVSIACFWVLLYLATLSTKLEKSNAFSKPTTKFLMFLSFLPPSNPKLQSVMGNFAHIKDRKL